MKTREPWEEQVRLYDGPHHPDRPTITRALDAVARVLDEAADRRILKDMADQLPIEVVQKLIRIAKGEQPPP